MYSTRRGWTIFTLALEKKSGGISVSSTGLFCFVRGGVVFFRRTPFRLFILCFRSPVNPHLRPCLSLLTRSPVSWSFSLGGINGRGSSQHPYNRTRSVPRESRARGRFTSSEETHKHPSVEARLQLAASSIAIKLQAGRSSRRAPELLSIENQPYLLRKTVRETSSKRPNVCAKVEIEVIPLPGSLLPKRNENSMEALIAKLLES